MLHILQLCLAMDKYRSILIDKAEYLYEDCSKLKSFTYQSSKSKELTALSRKYRLDRLLAPPSNEFKSMVRALYWVHENLIRAGDAVIPDVFNADSILSLTQSGSISSNCWMHAVVLNEVLLSLGFKSRMVRCKSGDIFDPECHCVVIAYSKQYGKWIMLDPANRSYFVNRQAIPLSLSELRHYCICDLPFYLPKSSAENFAAMKNYWLKNLVVFQCYKHSCFGSENLNNTVYNLVPVNCDKPNRYKTLECINLSNPDFFWSVP